MVCVLTACQTSGRELPANGSQNRSRAAGSASQVAPLGDAAERRFRELFLESVRQKQLEHSDAEAELLQEALRLDPKAPEALYELGILKLTYSTYSDSISRQEGDSLLRLSTIYAPNNLYYKESLATYLANGARYREAINLYEEIADTKLTPETLGVLVWLYKTNGDFAGAIRTLERLERLEGRSEAISMEKFQTYLAMKDTEHAYQAIEDLCAEYPLDLRYRVLLGDLYDQNGYHERALTIYKDVLTAEPDNSYAQISLLAYYKAADADSLYLDLLHRVVLNPHTQSGARIEAMRAYAIDNIKQGADSVPVLNLFNQALARPQTDTDMAELKAYYMVERRMPTDSIEAGMRTILGIAPDYTKARLQLLQILIQEDRMKEVAELCREGRLYDPAELTFYYYQGTALFMLGHNQEAVQTLQRGTERIVESTDPQLASDLWALLGDVLYEVKLGEEAFLAYDHALQYNELNLLCLNNYAYFLSERGVHLEKAEKMSRTTIEVEGDNATYLDTYAWILYLRRQYSQAQIYINEALQFTSEKAENASIFDHAGDISFANGQRSDALTFWRKALALTEDKADKAKIQRKIRRRRP